MISEEFPPTDLVARKDKPSVPSERDMTKEQVPITVIETTPQKKENIISNRSHLSDKELRLLNFKLGSEIQTEWSSKRVKLFEGPNHDRAVVKYSKYSDVHCECGAFVVSDVLGFELVPPVVIRIDKSETICLQEYIEGGRPYKEVESDPFKNDLYAVWIFDHIIRNNDRQKDNLLVGPNNHLVAIDHESAFYTIEEGHDLYKTYYGVECPIKVIEIFKRFLNDPTVESKLRQDLSGLLTQLDIEETVHRINVMGKLLLRVGKVSSSKELDFSPLNKAS